MIIYSGTEQRDTQQNMGIFGVLESWDLGRII